MKRKFWTEAEIDIVREFYPLGDFDVLLSRLPGRTEVSIRLMAHKLKVASHRGERIGASRCFIRDGVGYIRLTQGRYALVDPKDIERLSKWSWSFSGVNGYARRGERTSADKQKTIYMHREILKCPDNVEVDHANRNKLDNRRSNLRLATSRQNKINKATINRTSGYRGVFWHEKSRMWFAKIGINSKSKNLGYFASKKEAAKAYDTAARQHHGEFAILNFPENE